jgi:hypothetical protein
VKEKIMARASASKMLISGWSKDDFIRRTYHGEPLPRPVVYQRVAKEPGSFELTPRGFEQVQS